MNALKQQAAQQAAQRAAQQRQQQAVAFANRNQVLSPSMVQQQNLVNNTRPAYNVAQMQNKDYNADPNYKKAYNGDELSLDDLEYNVIDDNQPSVINNQNTTALHADPEREKAMQDYFESTTFEEKPTAWQKVKKAFSSLFKLRVSFNVPQITQGEEKHEDK